MEFLRQERVIQRGESPWPAWDEGMPRYPVDWGTLFPSTRPRGAFSRVDGAIPVDQDEIQNDDWHPDFPGGVRERLRENHGLRPLEPPGNSDDNGQAIWDRCAWYQPMHFFGPDWGIYIRQECILNRMVDIVRFLPRSLPLTSRLEKELCRSSLASFFLHEQFHHMVESLGIRMHVVQRRSAYLAYEAAVYRPTSGTDDNLEEALATANAYQRLGESPYGPWIGNDVLDATWEYIEWRVPADPPGYRQAVRFFDWEQFDSGTDLLQAQFDEARLAPTRNPHDWYFATRMMQSLFKVTDHLWEIVPTPTSRPLLPSP